jgi:ketosteroid isomerase-like protein
MPSQATEQDLIKLEKTYWEAIRDRDVEQAMRLTDDQCIVAGAQGVTTIDRQAFAGMMRSTAFTINEFELGPKMRVRFLTDDIAIVAYEVKERATVEGKAVNLDAADTSVWIRRNDRWVCTLHTESIRGDPWGRK